jgi:hypothetical protein
MQVNMAPALRDFTRDEMEAFILEAVEIVEATDTTCDTLVARLLAERHGGDYGDFIFIACTAGGRVQDAKDRAREVRRRIASGDFRLGACA